MGGSVSAAFDNRQPYGSLLKQPAAAKPPRQPGSSLRWKSPKRAADDERRDEVRARVLASGPCVLTVVDPDRSIAGPCHGPLTAHHVRKSSQGGAYEDENLLPCCAHHNCWIEDEPLLARSLGLVRYRGWEADEAERAGLPVAATDDDEQGEQE